jgi:hypothetical protein
MKWLKKDHVMIAVQYWDNTIVRDVMLRSVKFVKAKLWVVDVKMMINLQN